MCDDSDDYAAYDPSDGSIHAFWRMSNGRYRHTRIDRLGNRHRLFDTRAPLHVIRASGLLLLGLDRPAPGLTPYRRSPGSFRQSRRELW